ncbi:hypothetical protein ACFFQF_28855 [Haladaptatus pallidirubidus]|uniref:Uncharacterized protein n=1 Tax=Haladaptatus pallidirubidus TaxID=1008152 RepID=A0AAV3UK73_9EURY|nr:hypothetical protein [Haladaptatus pallidirubidus]
MIDTSYDEWDKSKDTSNIVFVIDADHDKKRTDIAIIADITKDDAWIIADAGDAFQLDIWR